MAANNLAGFVPMVGIIVPCFNQGRYAADCIASIRAQTHARWRVALIDDASTDDSAWLCENLASDRVTVIRVPRNLGRALVRNEGLRHLGEAEYVLSMDCDDVLSPNYVQMLVDALEADPSAGFAYGVLHYFSSEGSLGRTWPERPWSPERTYLENQIPGPGTLFRRAALAGTRLWRRDFTSWSGEDYDLWLQVVEAGWTPRWVPEAEYRYRQHSESFLATRANDETHLQVKLRILKHHRHAIRKSIGFATYLTPLVFPRLLANIRTHQWRSAASTLWALMRWAPATTVRLLGRHYAKRLRKRLGND